MYCRPQPWLRFSLRAAECSVDPLVFKGNERTIIDHLLDHARWWYFSLSIKGAEIDKNGEWFDHEDKLPNRPLYRIPEALALGQYTVGRPLVEAVIMIRIYGLKDLMADQLVKYIVQILRFFQAVIFITHMQDPKYFYTLGFLTVIAGCLEATISFWKEIAARVHKPGQPKYFDSPMAAHRGWYS